MIPNIHIHRQLAAEYIEERLRAKEQQRLIASLHTKKPRHHVIVAFCNDLYRGFLRLRRATERSEKRAWLR